MPYDISPDKTPRVRRRERTGQRTPPGEAMLIRRQYLLDAAARLLSRKSVDSVALTTIGREAGWSQNAAYSYYNDTDELLADLLVDHLVSLDHAVCSAFDTTEEAPATQRMTSIAYAFLNRVLTERDRHLALRLNTRLVSESRRPSVEGRSRQIIATLREVLFGCVPGLDQHPEFGGLVLRQWVGAMSETVTWFKDDDRVSRTGLAQLIMSQTLATARAVLDGDWVLPPPAPVVSHPAPMRVAEAMDEPRVDAIWISPEQARRSLSGLVNAVGNGVEVVLTRRGVPVAKLVPAAEERVRLWRLLGRGG